MGFDRSKIEQGVRLILEGIGDDPSRDGVVETPRRVADMYEEIFAGVGGEPSELVTVVKGAAHDEMIMVKDIPLTSACLIGCALLTGAGAVFNRAHVYRGDSVAVIGVGGIGISCIQAARIAGATKIIAVGAPVHDDARRQEARLDHGDLGAPR